MDHPGAELPILLAQSGPLDGQRWLLERTIVVGRDPSCDLIINDRQISRYHARFEATAQGVYLEDLGSKNGTYHNGSLVEEPVLLKDGDDVQMALIQHFTFLTSDATMPLEGRLLPVGQPKSRLVLDERSRRVWVNRKEVIPPLSVQQFRLLKALDQVNGQVISREQLIREVWGSDEAEGVSEQAFDALVRRLRERLNSADHEHAYIITIRGHGLRLDNPELV